MTGEQAQRWIRRGRESAEAGRGLPLAIEDTFSFGAVIYAALAIAHAEEPSARREQVQAALIALLRGLRSHPLPRNIGAAANLLGTAARP
jgi:hypothetical protein